MPTPQACQLEDAARVVDLLNDVFWTSEGREPELLELFPALYPPSDPADHRVIVEDGEMIAHVGIVPLTLTLPQGRLRIAGISGVCTRDDRRRRGLASLCMEDALRRVDAYEYDLSALSTGLDGFYERWGYARVGVRRQFRLTQPLPAGWPGLSRQRAGGGWRVEGYDDTDDQIAAMFELHENHPFRLERTATHLRRCLTARRRWSWLAWDGDRLAAYLVTGDPWHSTSRMQLYGGEARAAAALMGHAMVERGWEAMHVDPPPGDPLETLLGAAGIECLEHAAGMFRVADESRLLAKLGVSLPAGHAPCRERPVPESRLRLLLGEPGGDAPLTAFFLWPMDYC